MPSLRAKSLVKANIQYWMNDRFLREGLYTNVNAGDMDFYGNDLSLMLPVVGYRNYSSNQVFQSAFQNWVYESGIPSSESGVAPPTVASGVTVDGTFYPQATTTGTYEHFIDFENGMVVFSSPLAGSPTVQGTFAYKHVLIESANKLNNENIELLVETALKDNPQQTGVIEYPTPRNNVLPAVFIDFLKRDNAPYELGNRDGIKEFGGVFHIWTRDDYYQDILEDILSDAQREVILGINFNDAPFPLLSRGRRNPAYQSYETYANLYNQYHWRKIYLDTADVRTDPNLYEIQRSRVQFTIRTYPTF